MKTRARLNIMFAMWTWKGGALCQAQQIRDTYATRTRHVRDTSLQQECMEPLIDGIVLMALYYLYHASFKVAMSVVVHIVAFHLFAFAKKAPVI